MQISDVPLLTLLPGEEGTKTFKAGIKAKLKVEFRVGETLAMRIKSSSKNLSAHWK